MGFKNKYIPIGKSTYDSFLDIVGARTNGICNSANPNLMIIPFASPNNQAVYNYLKKNIEEEWRWKGWQLRLNFIQTTDPNVMHVVFVPGATPHDESLPGNIKIMDGNAPLS